MLSHSSEIGSPALSALFRSRMHSPPPWRGREARPGVPRALIPPTRPEADGGTLDRGGRGRGAIPRPPPHLRALGAIPHTAVDPPEGKALRNGLADGGLSSQRHMYPNSCGGRGCAAGSTPCAHGVPVGLFGYPPSRGVQTAARARHGGALAHPGTRLGGDASPPSGRDSGGRRIGSWGCFYTPSRPSRGLCPETSFD